MIRIGTIWDRTTETLAARGSVLVGIAGLLLLGPGIVQAAADAAASDGALGRSVAGLIGLAAAVLTLWGSLALTAAASDRATSQRDAIMASSVRLGVAVGLLAIAVLVAIVAFLPGVLLLVSAGFDMARAQAGLKQVNVDVARAGWAMLYFLLIGIVALWISARLVPLFAIIVNERRGVGAYSRSFALTRGSTLRLIGVLLLYAIVLLVVLMAATSIVGLAVRLVLGGEARVAITFATAVVSAIVTAGFAILQNVFSARFYLAAREARDAA